jgi:hypothetical protein
VRRQRSPLSPPHREPRSKRARDREEIAVRANDQTAKQQAEQMAEMMKGGAGVTAQGAGMDLGAAIQQAAGAAGQQAKPAAYDAAGQIES